MVLNPSCKSSVGVKVASRDAVTLTIHHAAEPGEVALNLIGVRAVMAVGDRVIDAAGSELRL